jgi:hypothetical protein
VRAPPELAELQTFLSSALRREQPIADDAALAIAVRAHVAGNDRLSPAEQADLYREQFWARHFESLTEDYIGLRALLGREAFEAFLTAYLTACPPRHPSLRDLGDRIVDFTNEYDGFAPELRAVAREMVRYENALVEVFDAAEPPALDAAKLGALDEEAWDRARIVLNPMLVRLSLGHPVHTYRIAAKAALDARESDCASCEPQADTAPPPPEARPVHLALFRPDLVVSYEELTPEAFLLLEALAAGDPLTRACEKVAEPLDEEQAADLMSKVGPWFQQWTGWRWIVDIETA